VIDNDHENFN
jgi:hypothetical protein